MEKVGYCYKLHWVLRQQDPCLGLGLSHWAVEQLEPYWLGCTPVCRVTVRVSRVVRCNSCSHPQRAWVSRWQRVGGTVGSGVQEQRVGGTVGSGVDSYRMEALL